RNSVGLDTLIEANPSIADPYEILARQEIIIPGEGGTSFTVNAYTAGYESTGKEKGDPGYGVTESGNYVQENQTMACPQSLDFGNEIHIPELVKTFLCEDRVTTIY